MDFESFNIFDAFGMNETTEDKADEVKETKKAKAEVVDIAADEVADTVDLESEAEDSVVISDSTEEEAKDKASKKKAAPKKKKESTLVGPVVVKGIGFTFTYGDNGVKYKPVEVAKAAYDAGYKEVALMELYHDGVSTVFCNFKKATNEDEQIGERVTILSGENRASYQTSDFGDLEAEEVSVFDLSLKYVESHPDFKGCSLCVDTAIESATPVFTKKVTLVDDKDYAVYSDGGNQTLTGAQIKNLYPEKDVTVVAYTSDADILFIGATTKNRVTASRSDFGIEGESRSVKTKELYRLPFVLWIETYGTKAQLTADNFGGKAVVDKNDIVDYLKNYYRIFRSQSRKFDISYDRNAGIVGVAVVSGEKGAAVAAPSFNIVSNVITFPFYRVDSEYKERVENTELGIFRGYENVETHDVHGVTFERKLPKIPAYLLSDIIKEFSKDLSKENMVQIYWSVNDQCYYIKKPTASYTKVRVLYEMCHTDDILALTIHSHNTMTGRFSAIDDADEIYTGLFGVIGNLDKNELTMSFRAGMEGSFTTIKCSELFSFDGFGGICA
ncbi:hypothetical protein [Butyrivibrio proteoclasticus]|uniref:hypothetical protein n=1 Tax=Butyrivibrio proteoclasticus TaxID=43305 RepID=UPI00047B637E|nr:hypothetical protein [Butyrivibrio proteoclasticus]